MEERPTGDGHLSINGKAAGESRFEKFGAYIRSIYGPLKVGRDSASPVSAAYQRESPYPFTGSIEQIQIALK